VIRLAMKLSEMTLPVVEDTPVAEEARVVDTEDKFDVQRLVR